MENTSISPDAFLNTPSPAVNYFTPLQSPPSGTYLGKEGSERPLLFTPLKIRDVVFQNRIWVSPMSQYSADDGRLTDWHLVQLGSYASRGASLIMTEATSVTPDGRCTLEDAGLWKDDQIESFKRVTDFIHSQGQKAGLQLQHAGRKASTTVPWIGFHGAFGENGWPETVFGPSSVAFNSSYCTPKSMTKPQIREVIAAFADSARRAVKAGYDLIELHGAHGYLLHQFLSPAANKRTDEYGGSFENRIRLSVETVRAVRQVIPEGMPLFFRLSVTDWLEPGQGWEPQDSVKLSAVLLAEGVDLMDASTGGIDPAQKIPVKPAFQAPFAKLIKDGVPGMLTAAVGMIYSTGLCKTVMDEGQADGVFVAREFSRNPSFVLDVARELKVRIKWPIQLHRVEPK